MQEGCDLGSNPSMPVNKMDEHAAGALLESEGYTTIYIWEGRLLKVHEPHFHRTDTKLIIQRGTIEITLRNVSKTYLSGDKVFIPRRTVHSASVGKEGCVYLVGERS